MKSKLLIIYFIALMPAVMIAQRHYEGVYALEGVYGTNVWGNTNTHFKAAISKYLNRTTYWKIGLNSFEKSFTYHKALYEIEEITYYEDHYAVGNTLYCDADYFKTFYTNRSSVWLNGGIGAFIGCEQYKQKAIKNESDYQFIFGPKLSIELEIFVHSRIAITPSIEQQWSPLSDLKHWNTIWGVGVKWLLY